MPKSSLRAKNGATLGLVLAVTITIVLLGVCFFFLVRMLGGAHQTLDATDAGALGAARAIVAVPPTADTQIAPEFQGLGVNIHTGQPDSMNGTMNIFAYNRAAGAATLIAMNALEENTLTAITNANTVIDSLQQFADGLNKALIESGKAGNITNTAFQNMISQQNVSMMGSNSATTLSGDLQFTSVTTGITGSGGKSNVYFNSATFNNDTFYTGLTPTIQDSSGSLTSCSMPDQSAPSYAAQPVFQGGQPLLKAYDPINLDSRLKPIWLAAVSPASQPHLIDQPRYSSGTPRIGFAPVNALLGQTQTLESNRSNTNIGNIACALVGSLFNEYPVTLVHGYIRIHNGPDARIANPSLSGIYGSVDGSSNVFNNALYAGPGGGGGIVVTNNGVFGTLWSGVNNEFNEWATYNQSVGTDPLHHFHHLDPTAMQQFGTYDSHTKVSQIYWPYPEPNVRVGSGNGQLATLNDMRGITSVVDYCTTATIDSDPICSNNLATYQSNFGGAGTGYSLPPGASVTNLEAFKGEVITQWLDAADGHDKQNWGSSYKFTTTGSEFAVDSGSKVYQRSGVAYATPTNSPTIAFGTVGTPVDLINQITQTQVAQGATACVDTSNASQWNNTSYILGRLLQRCQEILPGVTQDQIAQLLSTYKLDLGQYQYIYLPPGATNLAVSQTPPTILSGLPESATPGSTIPDGNPMPNCQDPTFAGVIGNQVDAQIGGGNIKGDNALHDMPFESFNGTADTYDYVQWRSSSGKDNLLGELSFFNHVDADATFTLPN